MRKVASVISHLHSLSFCHGDLNINNFIVVDREKVVILDWQGSDYGASVLGDVAFTYHSIGTSFGIKDVLCVTGYEKARFFLKEYIKRKGKIDAKTMSFHITKEGLLVANTYKKISHPLNLARKFGFKKILLFPFIIAYFQFRYYCILRKLHDANSLNKTGNNV